MSFQERILRSAPGDLLDSEINEFLKTTTPEHYVVIQYALSTGIISPNTVLVMAINVARTDDHLIYIGLALRAGANPNGYVNVPQVGLVHILAYAHISLIDKINIDLLTTIVCLLVTAQSRSVMPVFDNSKNDLKSLSVIEWLTQKNYPTPLTSLPSDSSQWPEQLLVRIALLLDRPDLAVNRPVVPEHAIVAYADKLLDSIVPDRVDVSESLLIWCVLNLNVHAFETIYKFGAMPNYFTLNKIILLMRSHLAKKQNIAFMTLKNILVVAIKYGSTIDKNQFAILDALPVGPAVTAELKKFYENPYWQKICTSPATPKTQRLENLAHALAIDPTTSKAKICESLSYLSRADPDRLKASAVYRQKMRLSATFSSIADYIVDEDRLGKNRQNVCRNHSTFDTDPYEYPDIDLAAYKDTEDRVWCYTSSDFDNLLADGRNTTTLEPLPQDFIDQVKKKKELLNRLGIKTTMPISRAVLQLTEKDTVSDDESQSIVDQFEKLALVNGVTKSQLQLLNRDQMRGTLTALGIHDSLDLEQLSASHAYVTYARAARAAIMNDGTNQIENFFVAIKMSLL
jgi:hypothetical protein